MSKAGANSFTIARQNCVLIVSTLVGETPTREGERLFVTFLFQRLAGAIHVLNVLLFLVTGFTPIFFKCFR